ncbi:MAG: tungstate ABC transporter substrate-binding protein WtpA [Candidatus Bathyarchaeia archaeon]|nr:tungstate ABC transporter substrate-binding protein WtpA [Candidatus Bathyarchaeia archaeon]
MPSKKIITTITTLIVIALCGFFYSYWSRCLFPDYLTIFQAGSLSVPMQKIGEEFSHKYSRIRIAFESSGSVDAIRKITDLNRSCDILTVADYNLIPKMMYDNHASWVIIFASNEMVIAYTDGSKYNNEINSTNWYEILSKDEVTIGRSDPNCDPCGYRALMVFELASIYYSDPFINTTLWEHSNTVVRPKSVELLALLEAGQIDYAFEYKSVAVQHNLNYVELPDEINLSNWTMSNYYASVNITISKDDEHMVITGAPILYGVTIPKNAEHESEAVDFVKFMLSQDGRNIIEECGQNSMYPAYTDDVSRVPSELREFVQQLLE